MPPKTPGLKVDKKGSRSRSRSRSPGRKAEKVVQAADPVTSGIPTPSASPTPSIPLKRDVVVKNGTNGVKKEEAVKDNDIMNLSSSDFQFMILLSVIAVCVRLFRIYQPSSVVFDEVQ